MRIKLRANTSAWKLAELHRRIAIALKAINVIRDDIDLLDSPLMPESDARIQTMAGNLAGALYTLEHPFLCAAHNAPNVPLANPNDPEIWLRWLETGQTN